MLLFQQFVYPLSQRKKLVGVGFLSGPDTEGCYFLTEVHRLGSPGVDGWGTASKEYNEITQSPQGTEVPTCATNSGSLAYR